MLVQRRTWLYWEKFMFDEFVGYNLRLNFRLRVNDKVKNDKFRYRYEYLHEIEAIFENALACQSGAQIS